MEGNKLCQRRFSFARQTRARGSIVNASLCLGWQLHGIPRDPYGTGLVGGLVRIGVEDTVGQLVYLRVVHRDKDLANLNGIRNKGLGAYSPAL